MWRSVFILSKSEYKVFPDLLSAIFTVRRYASAVYAVVVSITRHYCVSQRLNVRICKQDVIAQGL